MLLRKPSIENKNHPYNQILLIFTEASCFICTIHTLLTQGKLLPKGTEFRAI